MKISEKQKEELLGYIGIVPERKGYAALAKLLDEPYETPYAIDDTTATCISDSIEQAYACGKLQRLNDLFAFEAVAEKPTAYELAELLRMYLSMRSAA